MDGPRLDSETNQPDSETLEWWLIFSPDTDLGGYLPARKRLLKSGFRHVWAIRLDDDVWIAANSAADCIDIRALPVAPDVDLPRAFRLAGSRVVRVRKQRIPRWQHRGVLTCVSFVKNLLQLCCPWVLTPYQLYKWLEKPHDGVEVYRGRIPKHEPRSEAGAQRAQHGAASATGAEAQGSRDDEAA